MTDQTRNKRKCPTCGSTIAERRITLYNGMVKSLIKVYKYAEEKNIDRFRRRDVKHLFNSESESARFGDWVMFGGLINKEGRGKYIINRERCKKFLSGEEEIATSIWKDSVTGRVVERSDFRRVHEIEGILKFLDEEGMFTPEYRKRTQKMNL